MRALIVDDEPVAREVLRDYLDEIPDVEVLGECARGDEALARVLDSHPDLLFLDQEMPGLTGVALARSLKEPKPVVVFVTAYEQHALEAFDVGAVDYLCKPVRRERLEQAVDKARKLIAARPKPEVLTPAEAKVRKIVGRRGPDLYLLDPDDIIAFEADGETVHIITAQQKFLCEHPLKTLEQKLPPGQFRRVHRKRIINTDHIQKISPLSSKRWLLMLSGGYEAVVSKRLAGAIREQTRW
jgi:two-component system, LytTR family, response regulator